MGEKRYIISDASKMLGVESHVLRYWEEELNVVIPRNEMGDSITLKSFDHQTEPIIINDIGDIHFFGRIVTVIRK